METHMILQLTEILFAVCALGYGIFEHYKRQKLEKVLKTITQTYPGDVAKIEQSCVWAWSNVRYAHAQAAKIPECTEKIELLKFINLATGDTAASARMCSALFNQLLGFQQAQFETRIINHSEKDVLDLCKSEERNSSHS